MNLTQDEILMGNLDGAIRPPKPDPSELTAGFITVDPAFGMNSWNDDTALTVHARVRGTGIPLVIDSRVNRMTEDQTFDALLELSYYWGISTWVIEADAAQKILIPYFNLLFQNRKIASSIFLLLPVRSGGTNKAARITAFRNSVVSASYGICESEVELIDKLMEYSPESKTHDDRVDSAAYGPIVWELYDTIVDSRGIQQIAFLISNTSAYQSEIQGDEIAGI